MNHIDKIVRSNRKTVAIVIEPDGKVIVRAPQRLSRIAIERLVEEKSAWIRRHQEQLQKNQRLTAPPAYQPGEKHYFLGVPYPLEIVERSSPALELTDGRFLLAHQAHPRAAQVFETWYRKEAGRYIKSRVDALARAHRCSVKSVRITGAKTRWGSCGARSTLNFSWRLIMAPADAIDYVIIHELVHLEIRNHSRQFWEKVAEWRPDYNQQRRWLKTNAWLLK